MNKNFRLFESRINRHWQGVCLVTTEGTCDIPRRIVVHLFSIIFDIWNHLVSLLEALLNIHYSFFSSRMDPEVATSLPNIPISPMQKKLSSVQRMVGEPMTKSLLKAILVNELENKCNSGVDLLIEHIFPDSVTPFTPVVPTGLMNEINLLVDVLHF